MANPNQKARDSRGHYIRTLDTIERDAEAARLRGLGYTYPMIAEMLGYPSRAAAREGVEKILKEAVTEPAAELLTIELQRLDAELVRLDDYEQAARKVLERSHLTVSHGKVISTTNPDTQLEEPLLDDGPVLQAIDRLVRIEDARRRNAERRAKLLGLDAPTRVDAIVHEATQQDLELQQMLREAKAKVAAQEQTLRDSREADEA